MKKIMIATDLHGSAYWTQKVAEKFAEEQADVLVLLGDVYNHGPRNPLPREYDPMKVADILNGLADKLLVVQGNCDSDVDQMISRFDFLRENVLFFGGRRLFLTHGHLHNKDHLPHLSAGDVCFYGHFHQNEVTDADGVLAVCVGSASLPKDGVHAYVVAEKDRIVFKDLDGGTLREAAYLPKRTEQ